jgi:hypothetical protein
VFIEGTNKYNAFTLKLFSLNVKYDVEFVVIFEYTNPPLKREQLAWKYAFVKDKLHFS